MIKLTIHLPDETVERLKVWSKGRGMSVNRLINEVANLLLTEPHIEERFQARAASGLAKAARGVKLLHKAARR